MTLVRFNDQIYKLAMSQHFTKEGFETFQKQNHNCLVMVYNDYDQATAEFSELEFVRSNDVQRLSRKTH